MTRVDQINEVRQLRYIQNLPIREISRRLNLSRNTIRKILRSQQVEFVYERKNPHNPVTDIIKGKVREWFEEDLNQKKKYRRTGWRMYEILKYEYGYKGSYACVAKAIREIKAEKGIEEKEAYIPLVFGSGEAFQFDWGEVIVYLGKEQQVLQLGVIELCDSRHFYPRVYPCQKQELLLDVHRRAFEYFGGIPRRGIYDNLKTAVKHMLKGNHRNLQNRFEKFSSHYLYKPEFCNPARGNEKGRVENMIGYIRRNFFAPIPRIESLDELNERLLSFAIATSREKKHPEMVEKTRYEVYEEEKKNLTQLPPYAFECCRENISVVAPYSTIPFDGNKYSVPAEYVGRTVLIKGYAGEIVVSYGGREIARHKRLFAKKKQVFNPYHYLGLLQKKPRALNDGLPFKDWKLPEVFLHYRKLLNEKYEDGDRYFAKTLILLRDWSISEVVEAINKAVELGVLGDSYLLTLLRQKKDGITDMPVISIKVELSRYSAQQKPLSYYDDMLRRKETEVNIERKEGDKNGGEQEREDYGIHEGDPIRRIP
jgi:transposase